ncbi:MAG TPA: BamA/TamA family outer membrane protein [Polyangiales bacterium]|nr:BamA/TamA family outer membrane protein [Polyangiales bacterium]
MSRSSERRRAPWLVCVCAWLIASTAAIAQAQPQPATEPVPVPATESAPAPATESAPAPAPALPPIADPDDERPVPDYDGREEPTTAGDVLIWVPRLVLSPLWVVSEFVIRRPLGFLITAAEQAHVPELLLDFFTFGPDNNVGMIPIAFIDFGFDPSVGLYLWWDDAFTDGHDLRLRASTWGDDWLAASISDRWDLGRERAFAIEATAIRRPDYVFYGIGPSTREEDVSRYGSTRYDGRGQLDIGLWRGSRFSVALGARSVSFHRGHYGDDPSLGEAVAAGLYTTPEHYEPGYTAIYQRTQVAFDSREGAPEPGGGVRIEAEVEHQGDVRRDPGAGMLRWGGGIGGFYDLDDHRRVVSVALTASFADPLGHSPVPFTELATVGGEGSMRGFLPGRLRDRSAAVASLHYRWPIWVLLDGSIQLSVGNVFGAHLDDFDPDQLRFSGAIGVESVGSPDSSLELLFGVGSETFAQGGRVESLRFAVGTNHGF